MSILHFEKAERSRHQLVLRYRVDDLRFSTTYWYDTVDLIALEDRLGVDFMRRVYFHALAFEANKAASLKPEVVDFGPYADLVTTAFWELWETIFHHVWGVWRFENDLPDYRLANSRTTSIATSDPITVDEGPTPLLMLCGGGKDSLVSMRLLERGGVPYDTLIYSHSAYGRGRPQHDLIDRLVAHCDPIGVHRGWVVDDALEAPVARALPELDIKRVVAAETVSSYWIALPVALHHGHTEVALGISRSTDEHNLVWDRTGEEINYLWGMSARAEDLLYDYVKTNLVRNLSFFHILRPIYDVTVFGLLGTSLDAVPSTHSCAQLKPWCCRCAKCIYVWMNYVAWLPAEVVAATFDVNLFELDENRSILRKMLGLESYKPTDCVGTVSEARLAFAMCRTRGVGGLIADDIDVGPLLEEMESTLEKYGQVAAPGASFPGRISEAIFPQLHAGASSARRLANDGNFSDLIDVQDA